MKKASVSAVAGIIVLAVWVSAGFGAGGPTGEVLYSRHCEACHSPIANTTIVRGSTVTMAQYAMKSNLGGMRNLSGISPNDISSIFSAIASSGKSASSSAVNGPSPSAPSAHVYVNSAAAQAAVVSATVGASQPSAAKGATSSPAAPADLPGGGAADAGAAVASAPAPSPSPAVAAAPPDGAALYAADCAFCHGPLASSSKRGASVARIQTAIGMNSGGMASLANIQPSDLLAISSALNGGGTTTQFPAFSLGGTSPSTPAAGGGTGGAGLYDSNCSRCHGPLASSSKRGASAGAIQGAISAGTGGMGSLSTLSATDIQAIASALGGGGAAGSVASRAGGTAGSSGGQASGSGGAVSGSNGGGTQRSSFGGGGENEGGREHGGYSRSGGRHGGGRRDGDD